MLICRNAEGVHDQMSTWLGTPDLNQGSANFFALRTSFSLALFGGPTLNKIMSV